MGAIGEKRKRALCERAAYTGKLTLVGESETRKMQVVSYDLFSLRAVKSAPN
jgi:hypothetical protein